MKNNYARMKVPLSAFYSCRGFNIFKSKGMIAKNVQRAIGKKTVCLIVLIGSHASYARQKEHTLMISWNDVTAVSKTTPTLQLVENPMVRPGSLIHQQAFKALGELGADYVRYVLWFPYPKMAMAELKPPTDKETFWNFTYPDSTMKAFMEATDGHSVVVNFSITPAWMWKTGSVVKYPEDPYQTCWNYNQGKQLRDTTMKELSGYFARLLSWYTRGGFTDELGKFHKSVHFYKIPYWEVLNEPDLEHNISPGLYARMYDVIVNELKKGSPKTKFIGLSLASCRTPSGQFSNRFVEDLRRLSSL
jgi:hypothetical protein